MSEIQNSQELLGDEAAPKELKKRSIFEMFGTDDETEQRGFVLEFGEGVEITIARAGGSNKKFQRFHEAKMRPYRTQIAAGTMDEDVTRGLLAESYAHAIVLKWKGVRDDDGKDIPFTKQNVIDVLLAVPDFFDTIFNESTRMVNYQLAGIEADAKI
jgi:hypothetical protein